MNDMKTIKPDTAGRRQQPIVSGSMVPVPRGMSYGFHAFMGGVGTVRDTTGTLMMFTPNKAEIIDSMVRYEKFAKRTGKTVVDLPFDCVLCHKPKMDLEMIDGDGFPICVGCIDAMTARMESWD